MNDEKPIRVLLVDDHEMVRQGLVFFLSTRSDITIVGQAANGRDAVQLVDELLPDVVLMDLILPEMDGIAATREVKERHPQVEILALTSYVDAAKVTDALVAGAAGYVLKDVSPDELTRAIRVAAAGEIYLAPKAAQFLAKNLRSPQPTTHPPDLLTDRELELLCLLARGLSNQDIAAELTLSVKTVKTHISNIFQKLDLHSRTQAALYAIRHNLVQIDDL